jgi:hypothetical protein
MSPRHVVIPTEAYPLQWPDGVPRTGTPKYSAFGVRGQGVPCGVAIQEVLEELRRHGARTIVISTNLPTRADGLPMASASAKVSDNGTAVYWTERVRDRLAPHVITCDRWRNLGCNLHAISLSLQALRGLDRWGAVRREQAFAGFRELPGGDTPVARPWREVLGGMPSGLDAKRSLELARARYRALMASHHPDRGGDLEVAISLNKAIEEAIAELGMSR